MDIVNGQLINGMNLTMTSFLKNLKLLITNGEYKINIKILNKSFYISFNYIYI